MLSECLRGGGGGGGGRDSRQLDASGMSSQKRVGGNVRKRKKWADKNTS